MDALSEGRARELSPAVLAFYGDSVYESLIRRHIVEKGNAAGHLLHKQSVEMARAKAQAAAAKAILPKLTSDEADILRRGRNTAVTTPRSSNPGDYHLATGLEALFGFLYLTGREGRAEELFQVICDEKQKSEERKD